MVAKQERRPVSDWLWGGKESLLDQEYVITLPGLPLPPEDAFVKEFDQDPLFPERGGLRVCLSSDYLTAVAREILSNGTLVPASQFKEDGLRKAVIYSVLISRGEIPSQEAVYFIQRPMEWGPPLLRGRVQAGPVGSLEPLNPLILQASQLVIEHFPRGARNINGKDLRQRLERGEGITAWALPELLEEVVVPPGEIKVFPAGIIAPERGPFALVFFIYSRHPADQTPVAREERREGIGLSYLTDLGLLFSGEKVPDQSDTWTKALIETTRSQGGDRFLTQIIKEGTSGTYFLTPDGIVYLAGREGEWLCVAPQAEAFRDGDFLGYP
jgi:hypothetical protein